MTPGRIGRVRRVKRMLSRLQAEKIKPDDSDIRLLYAYQDNKISLKDLINHAQQFLTREDYDKWIYDSNFQESDGPQKSLDDQFISEVEALVRRKRMSHRP